MEVAFLFRGEEQGATFPTNWLLKARGSTHHASQPAGRVSNTLLADVEVRSITRRPEKVHLRLLLRSTIVVDG